jgi:hypothetical protein
MSWTVCKDFDIVTRMIDNETLVYYQGSGDTHRLNSEAGVLLNLLIKAEAPLSSKQLIKKSKPVNASQHELQTIENILHSLSVLKFVKKVD